MPETFRSLTEEFRQRILDKDADAVIFVLKEYSSALTRIQKELDSLLALIERLRRQGKIVSETDLLREVRYRSFIAQIREEMVSYADLVTAKVSKVQLEAISLAFEQADASINFIFQDLPSGILESFTRFDEYSARNIIVKLNDERYLKSLTGKFEPLVLQGIREVLVDGVITGRSLKDVKRDLISRFEIVPNRAETIARTEINSAYREGNLERYRLSRTVKAWEWSATLDERTCPICIALDGRQFPLETVFATHPNCRCSPIPITYTFEELGLGYLKLKEPTPPDMGKRGEDWFRAQSKSVQERILGRSKFELYNSNQITLSDLVQEFTHPVYGPSRQERSVKSLKALRLVE